GLAGVAAEFVLFSELPILAGHGARRRIARILGERGVTVHSGRKVVAAGENGLGLDGGERFEAQAAVWATGAYAPPWIAQSALACPHQLRRSLRGRLLGAVFAGRRLGVALEGPHRPPLRGAIPARTGRRMRAPARIRLPVSSGSAIGKVALFRKEEP